MLKRQPLSDVYRPSADVIETADYVSGLIDARRPAGRVYLARAECTPRMLKIGWTRGDPEKRVAEIRYACPFRLVLLASIPGDQQHERMLHSIFRRFHVQGEWFSQHADIAWTFKRIKDVCE